MHAIRRTAFLTLLCLLPAAANDTSATLGMGGLVPVKSTAIAMESEDLQISVHQVIVKYVFLNTTNRSVNVIVAFPLPELDGGWVANSPIEIPSKDPVNFVDFAVLVDGKRVVTNVETRAFSHGSEITNDLRSLGLPLSPVNESVTSAYNRLPRKERKRIRDRGWIDCSLTGDGKCWAYWQSRVQFYWTQNFPARTRVEVEHKYRPVVGGLLPMDSYEGTSSADYCGGVSALEQISRLKKKYPSKGANLGRLKERTIDYILTTANNWKGPIRRFRLSILTDHTDDLVMTCLPGLRRVTPMRYELVRSDFRPDQELKLMLLQVNQDRHSVRDRPTNLPQSAGGFSGLLQTSAH